MMWAVVEIDLLDGSVRDVTITNSWEEALDLAWNMFTESCESVAGEEYSRERLRSFGYLIDGDWRVEIIQAKGNPATV